MDKKTKKLALAAGARTETDFNLFANLVNLRKQFKKELDEMTKVPTGIPPPWGILLRYDFFLERGRFFQAQPLPKGYPHRKAQECYRNSFRLAISRDGLTYCEGIVVLSLPNSWAEIEHGWCVTGDGMVIDVTFGKPGLSYFGVTFRLEDVAVLDSVPVIDKIIETPLEELLNLPDDSTEALQELVRVLEEALRAGASSVGLEYEGKDLIVFHNFGNTSLGAARISRELQQAVINELVKRAGLARKSKGKMPVSLLGKDYEAIVEVYDSFGESAYNLTLKERKKKAVR